VIERFLWLSILALTACGPSFDDPFTPDLQDSLHQVGLTELTREEIVFYPDGGKALKSVVQQTGGACTDHEINCLQDALLSIPGWEGAAVETTIKWDEVATYQLRQDDSSCFVTAWREGFPPAITPSDSKDDFPTAAPGLWFLFWDCGQ